MPPLRRHLPALFTSIALSLWFMLVYGLGNYLASLRPHVGTWVYAWERHIPLVPWLIVPYMSIDAFFFLAPFLCSDAIERRTLAKRIIFSIAVAGIFFIAMPLKLDGERPVPSGVFAPIFRFLHGFDAEFNLLPSLHITLRTILAVTFARHTSGHWRVASMIWFSLIGFSTVLVHQHHVVDIVGGFMLAAIAFYVFPELPTERFVNANARVARLYAIGAIVCTLLAFAWPWWSLWILWPAISLALAAWSAGRVGPAIYRKQNGLLPISTRLILAPFLAGQWLSLRHYARRSNPHDVLTDRVIIGRRLNPRELADLIAKKNVTAIVDLTAEFSACTPSLVANYCNVQIADLTAPSDEQLSRAVTFIERHAAAGVVYIHCKAGYSRTAAVAGAALLSADRGRSVESVIESLRAARRGIVIRPEIVACLHRYHDTLRRRRQTSSDTPIAASVEGSGTAVSVTSLPSPPM